nr:MAG TPA: hypothetical protein [Caudoviricetes sp.]
MFCLYRTAVLCLRTARKLPANCLKNNLRNSV